MGSKRYGGVWFRCYTHDHLPIHFHAIYGGLRVIVEFEDGCAMVSSRRHSVKPGNGSPSAIRRILSVANDNYEALMAQWRLTHG